MLVTREDLVADMAQIASDAGAEQLISVVTGGESRTGSVTNGVRKAAELGFELVAVHDAARPLSTTAMFEAVFDEVERSGAAIVAIPVADTLKRVDEAGVIEGTVDRSGLWAAHTAGIPHKRAARCARTGCGCRHRGDRRSEPVRIARSTGEGCAGVGHQSETHLAGRSRTGIVSL
ncbi:MAG: 2-C-methyl-D-erythritol 4-phosphate cytidylyltransferase [Thermomicrobiales bacterium]